MFCKNCGTQLKDDDTVCSRCGTEVIRRSVAPTAVGESVIAETAPAEPTPVAAQADVPPATDTAAAASVPPVYAAPQVYAAPPAPRAKQPTGSIKFDLISLGCSVVGMLVFSVLSFISVALLIGSIYAFLLGIASLAFAIVSLAGKRYKSVNLGIIAVIAAGVLCLVALTSIILLSVF